MKKTTCAFASLFLFFNVSGSAEGAAFLENASYRQPIASSSGLPGVTFDQALINTVGLMQAQITEIKQLNSALMEENYSLKARLTALEQWAFREQEKKKSLAGALQQISLLGTSAHNAPRTQIAPKMYFPDVSEDHAAGAAAE